MLSQIFTEMNRRCPFTLCGIDDREVNDGLFAFHLDGKKFNQGWNGVGTGFFSTAATGEDCQKWQCRHEQEESLQEGHHNYDLSVDFPPPLNGVKSDYR